MLAVLASAPVFAQDASKADNTQINQRDRHAEHATPMDQSNDPADIQLAAKVRAAIVSDDSLSMSAHNLKLLAAKGTVTLRGPVKDAAEKARVESVVRTVVGVNKVENQLDIKQ
jgi:osmotically-inducible protein OsmY